MLPAFLLPSKHVLLDGAAYLSLFLTIAKVLWPKFTEVLHMLGESGMGGIEWLYGVKQRLREFQSATPGALPSGGTEDLFEENQ